MRNLLGIIAAILIFASVLLMIITGGILDTPHSPISAAMPYAIATVITMVAGGIMANLYERGRV